MLTIAPENILYCKLKIYYFNIQYFTARNKQSLMVINRIFYLKIFDKRYAHYTRIIWVDTFYKAESNLGISFKKSSHSDCSLSKTLILCLHLVSFLRFQVGVIEHFSMFFSCPKQVYKFRNNKSPKSQRWSEQRLQEEDPSALLHHLQLSKDHIMNIIF